MAAEVGCAHGADAGMVVTDLFGVDEEAAVEFGNVGVFVDVVKTLPVPSQQITIFLGGCL